MIDDQVVSFGLTREVAVDDLGLQQALAADESLEVFVIRIDLLFEYCFVLSFRQRTPHGTPLPADECDIVHEPEDLIERNIFYDLRAPERRVRDRDNSSDP